MGTRFRAAPVYVDNRKIAEIESGTYEHNSNDEAHIGVEGYIGHSDGADMCTVSFNTVTPVAGHEFALKQVILDKRYVQIGLPIDGGYEAWEGRMLSRSYNWDSKTGSCKGSFKFEGGKPTVV